MDLKEKQEKGQKEGSNDVAKNLNGILAAQQIEANTQWTK
jgi:hypothetical protein